jgi:hypothetical protein
MSGALGEEEVKRNLPAFKPVHGYGTVTADQLGKYKQGMGADTLGTIMSALG